MDQEQKRTFDNTSSSYLSLKAELLRKKQDVQRASSSTISSSAMLNNLQSTSSSLRLKTKVDLDVEVSNPSKKKKKIEETNPTPTPSSTLSREDEIAFAKSRAILEAKSKLYDEIMSNNEMKLLAEDDGDDNDESFLVDFERKIYETNQKQTHMEYTDSFGRTRLVTRDEYERLKSSEKKKTSSEERISSNNTEDEINRVERLHREQMRSKWESDMDALRNKTHVHYQDILFDEKREHGIGFYKFSTDDKQRAEQMATLNDLRTNTKNEQMKFSQEKEKRTVNMSDRLNKIRLRKAKEMGINLSGDDKDQSEIKSTQEIREQVPIVKNDEEDKQIKLPEITIQTTQVQSSKQNVQPIHTQQPPLLQNNIPNGNPSMAYPFPVLRTNTHSS
ncbi:unnamed protein product [Adineta steineri]|uniref:Uncharacterized protein n=1 Tax=Adineta steineri TaxID=433720 RepID=A0A818HNM2_9BILA|nr:unnamed protein product [Adineta steineri]CAF3507474.1 unnamed protein product [Adineta steineri]